MPSLLGAAGRDPELDRLTRELGEERARPVREILARAVARGELPADLDEEVALGLVVGPSSTARSTGGCRSPPSTSRRASTPPSPASRRMAPAPAG